MVTVGESTYIIYSSVITGEVDTAKPVTINLNQILAYQNGPTINISTPQILVENIATIQGLTYITYRIMITPYFSHQVLQNASLSPISVWTDAGDNISVTLSYYLI
jgi:hypothetical protein